MSVWRPYNLRPGLYITKFQVRRIIQVFETYSDMDLSFAGYTTAQRVQNTEMVETDPRFDCESGSRSAEDAWSFCRWANAHEAVYDPGLGE
jgi:hypothetical protein